MGLIIGEKNPMLVQSEDISNLARKGYGKHIAENAIGNKEPVVETTEDSVKSDEDVKEPQADNSTKDEVDEDVKEPADTEKAEDTKTKKGGRPKKS